MTTAVWSRASGLAVILPLCFSVASTSAAQDKPYQIYEFHGDDEESDHFGHQVAAAGDMDRDGRDDLLVVGWKYTRVFSGADGTLIGQIDGLYWSGASCGDLNGDGFPEIVLGDNDNWTKPPSGKADVISGAWIVTGTGPQILHTFRGVGEDRLGESVAGIDDVDLDGVPDIAVGAAQRYRTGYIRVFSGRNFELLWQSTGKEGKAIGMLVRGAGDVNNDGHPDVITGGRHASVISGKDGRLLWSFATGRTTAVDGIGDVNGDGHDDIILGVAARSEVQVLSGKDGTPLVTIRGPARLGDSVAGVGDFNGDGIPDLIAGAPRSRIALVISGKDPEGTILARFDAPQPTSLFAWDVTGAGDLNGDGLADVMVGTISPNLYAGSAYVFSGTRVRR